MNATKKEFREGTISVLVAANNALHNSRVTESTSSTEIQAASEVRDEIDILLKLVESNDPKAVELFENALEASFTNAPKSHTAQLQGVKG